jgi:hypothetical protein
MISVRSPRSGTAGVAFDERMRGRETLGEASVFEGVAFTSVLRSTA